MEWLFEQLAMERQMIEGAPSQFIFAVAAMSLLGWLVLRFLYRERIESLTQIIGLYKDRYGPLDSESRTQFGKLRSSQLRKRAEVTAKGLDELVGKLNAATEEHVSQQSQQNFSSNAAKLVGAFQHVSAVYERDFKQDAILLRAELSSRIKAHGLSDPGPPVSGMGAAAFEHPTNTFGFHEVSSELRRLAKLLP